MADSKTNETAGTVKLFNADLKADVYNIVARKAQLAAVQLVSSHFDVKPRFFSEIDDLHHELCHKIMTLYVHEEEKMVAGIFRYELVSKKGRQHLSTARAEFLAAYNLPDGYEENEAKAFCARVGLFAAYPYFRALHAHQASAANMEMPPLPVLSTDPLRRTEGKQTTKAPAKTSAKTSRRSAVKTKGTGTPRKERGA